MATPTSSKEGGDTDVSRLAPVPCCVSVAANDGALQVARCSTWQGTGAWAFGNLLLSVLVSEYTCVPSIMAAESKVSEGNLGMIEDEEIPAVLTGDLNVVDYPDLAREGFATKRSEFHRREKTQRRPTVLWMTLFSCLSSVLLLLPYFLGYEVDHSDSALSQAVYDEAAQKISILCVGISLPLILEQITILKSSQPLVLRVVFYIYFDIPMIWILLSNHIPNMLFICFLLSTINFTFHIIAISIYQLNPQINIYYIISIQLLIFGSEVFEFIRLVIPASIICIVIQHIFYLVCVLNIILISVLLVQNTYHQYRSKDVPFMEFLIEEMVSLHFIALALSIIFSLYAIAFLFNQIFANRYDSLNDAGSAFIIIFTLGRTALLLCLSIMQRYVLSLSLLKSDNELDNKKAFIRYIRYCVCLCHQVLFILVMN